MSESNPETKVIVIEGETASEETHEAAETAAIEAAASAVATAAEAVANAATVTDDANNEDETLWLEIMGRFDGLEAQQAATQEMMRITAEAIATLQGQQQATTEMMAEILLILKPPLQETTPEEAPPTPNSPSESEEGRQDQKTEAPKRRLRIL